MGIQKRHFLPRKAETVKTHRCENLDVKEQERIKLPRIKGTRQERSKNRNMCIYRMKVQDKKVTRST